MASTLIELLVVIVILGILMAIAIPSYLSFRDRPTPQHGRAAVPAVEAYNTDNVGGGASGGYTGMTVTALQACDSAIVPAKLTIGSATARRRT